MSGKTVKRYSLHLGFQNEATEIEQLIHTLDSLLSDELMKGHSAGAYITDPYVKAYIQVNRYYQLKNLFPSIVWASILLTIYSLLEHTLDNFCDLVQQEKSLLLSTKDLKDRGIKRSEKYLSKVAEVSFPSKLKEWRTIQEANTIRNCLAHASGLLDDCSDHERLKSIVSRDSNLRIIDGRLIVSQKYVIGLLLSARIIMAKLTGLPISISRKKIAR